MSFSFCQVFTPLIRMFIRGYLVLNLMPLLQPSNPYRCPSSIIVSTKPHPKIIPLIRTFIRGCLVCKPLSAHDLFRQSLPTALLPHMCFHQALVPRHIWTILYNVQLPSLHLQPYRKQRQ